MKNEIILLKFERPSIFFMKGVLSGRVPRGEIFTNCGNVLCLHHSGTIVSPYSRIIMFERYSSMLLVNIINCMPEDGRLSITTRKI